MNELMPFSYGDHEVRVELADGEPWFVAADLCAALGLKNPSQAVKRLDPADLQQMEVRNARGELRPTNMVNEPGMYELVGRSDKPAALEFQRWISHEVLPSIRKTGTYTMPTAEPLAERVERGFANVTRWATSQQTTVANQQAMLSELLAQQNKLINHIIGVPATSQPAFPAADPDERITGVVFCFENGLPRDNAFVKMLGHHAADIGRYSGYEVNKVEHPRYPGGVHSWPRRVWEQARREVA